MARGGCFGFCCGSTANRDTPTDEAPVTASTREGSSRDGEDVRAESAVWELHTGRDKASCKVAIGERFGGSAGSRVHRGVVLRRPEDGGALAVAVHVADCAGADGSKESVLVRFEPRPECAFMTTPCCPRVQRTATIPAGHTTVLATAAWQALTGRKRASPGTLTAGQCLHVA